MKRFRQYIAFVSMLLMGAAASCSKDDASPAVSPEKADVTVRLNSRATDVTDPNAQDDEGIKTLRLIVVQNGTIRINAYHDLSERLPSPLQQAIHIIGLPAVENTVFYAVVNPTDNMDFESQYEVGTNFDEEKFNGTLLNPEMGFPRKGGEDVSLPMAGKTTVATVTDGMEVEIPVTRAVARIDLDITNKTGAALDISQVNFGRFFPGETHLVSPTNTGTYNTHDFTENETIAVNGTERFTYYVYESFAGADAFTVGLNNSTEFPLTQICGKDGQAITQLLRNNILRIAATANSSGWELRCEVAPWDLEEYELNFEEGLSYASAGWKPGTIVGRNGNTVELSTEMAGELNFTVQSPNAATWVAVLDDNVNFTLETPEGHELFDEDGNPIEQTVRISLPAGGNEYKETTLHVYAVVGGMQYELDLTGGGGEVGTVNNRFTITRGEQ